jgi:hypothetical protein
MYESIENENTTVPNAGRIYDHLLGGASNFIYDREAAEDILTALPQARSIARANRAFLTTVVRHLLDLGIRQFLDIGSGISAIQPIHETAVDARIVYVDRDPTAVAHNTFALYNRWDATAVRCDLRYPDQLLTNDRVRDLIDFDQPVALLLMAVLQFVADSDAYPAVAVLREALARGSYLALSHPMATPAVSEHCAAIAAVYRRTTTPILSCRDRTQIARFYDGLELVPPGLASVAAWRPDADAGTDIGDFPIVGALAGKP